ncbi:MAG: hypothetical protein RL563_74 [Pseudomonadota bacterium]
MLICEGCATGASLHDSTGHFVVVTMGKKKALRFLVRPYFYWWRHRESNLEPRGYESRALTD